MSTIREIVDTAVSALKALPVVESIAIRGVDLCFEYLVVMLELRAVNGVNEVFACFGVLVEYGIETGIVSHSPSFNTSIEMPIYTTYDQMYSEHQKYESEDDTDDDLDDDWDSEFEGSNIIDMCYVRGIGTSFERERDTRMGAEEGRGRCMGAEEEKKQCLGDDTSEEECWSDEDNLSYDWLDSVLCVRQALKKLE